MDDGLRGDLRDAARAQPPGWARMVLGLDAAIRRLVVLEEAAVERAMCLFIDPPQRGALTNWLFSRQTQYLPGSQFFRRGLFPWEETAIATAPFPPAGRVLLGGAGGGREAEALCERGYTVTAFDPAENLVEGARAVMARYPGSRVVLASYDDVVEHVRGGSAAFAGALEQRFDAVILGWTSLTHVIEEGSRIALLRALKTLAPEAPVLVSYRTRRALAPDRGAGRRMRAVLKILALLRIRTHEPPAGLVFSPQYGFSYLFDDDEMGRLAATAGYRVCAWGDASVVLSAPQSSAWALLAPNDRA